MSPFRPSIVAKHMMEYMPAVPPPPRTPLDLQRQRSDVPGVKAAFLENLPRPEVYDRIHRGE